MAQNVIIKGDWTNVPEVLLNKEGGGKARFVDTSPTTATDEDVAQGKVYFKANGDQSVGTGSGGGPGAFSDVVVPLPGGGDHHIITGVDISHDTVTAQHLETGYTAHDAAGNAISGQLLQKTLTTKSITQNGTYDATDDNAAGYSSVTVNVQGGVSNWTLLASQEFTVNTTNTSNTSVGDIQLPNNNYGQEDIIWVHIRDKAGKRAGYVYGTDTIFLSYGLANNSTSYLGVRPVEVTYVTSAGAYTGVVTAYGVYGYRLYYTSSAHYVRIYSRYNSTYGTINGTFKCDVYKLTTPSGFTMYE